MNRSLVGRRFLSSCFAAVVGVFLVLGNGLSAVAQVQGNTTAAQDDPVAVIYHVNDVHGYLYQDSDVGSIGQDYIAALRDQTEASVPATFLFSAGDMIQGNFFVNQDKGEAAVEIMNAADYDGMTLGNHEFDYGLDWLKHLATLSDTPMLTQTEFLGEADSFQPYVLSKKGEITLGVFGITTPETPRSSGGAAGLNFGTVDELVAYSQEMADTLRQDGADIVICLSHLGIEDVGYGTSYDIRDQVQGLDLIIDGHSHTAYADIQQAEGKALIVSSGEYAQYLGCVEFYQTNDGYTPVEKVLDQSSDVWTGITPKADVTTVIDKWKDAAQKAGSAVIGVSPIAVNDSDRSLVRMQETMIGNLVADSIREAAQTDVAVMNGGSIRANLEKGDITVEEVNSILPYSNYILKADVKGSVILDTLEVGVSRYAEQSGGFLQVSGVSFTFDPSKEPMSRVSEVKIDGVLLDPDATYSMATNDFLAAGGDSFDVLKAAFANAQPIPDGDLTNIFATYLTNHQSDLAPKLEGRIVMLDENGNAVESLETVPQESTTTVQESESQMTTPSSSEKTSAEESISTAASQEQVATIQPILIIVLIVVIIAAVLIVANILTKRKNHKK
jgi:5'-nucleotidase